MSRDRVMIPYRRVVLLVRESELAGKGPDWILDVVAEHLDDGSAVLRGDQAPARRRTQPKAPAKARSKPKATGKTRTRRTVAKLAAVLPIRQEAPTAAHGEP